jgi:chromosome segregation ATPase
MTSKESRQRFESTCCKGSKPSRLDDGYLNPAIQAEWRGWQAAIAECEDQIARADAALKEGVKNYRELRDRLITQGYKLEQAESREEHERNNADNLREQLKDLQASYQRLQHAVRLVLDNPCAYGLQVLRQALSKPRQELP